MSGEGKKNQADTCLPSIESNDSFTLFLFIPLPCPLFQCPRIFVYEWSVVRCLNYANESMSPMSRIAPIRCPV